MKNSWTGKRVLITGANGFLASWIVKKLLVLGADVNSLIFEDITSSLFYFEDLGKSTNIIRGDILDFELMKSTISDLKIDLVIHLAAQAINKTAVASPYMTLETNIRGTYNLLEAIRVASPETKIIVASSDKAYGIHKEMPYMEDYSLHGEYPYEVSKSCADLICTAYFKTYNLPVCVVRSSNIYGEGDWHFSRVVPATIIRVNNKLSPLLIDETERDYSYVGDIADGYLRLAEAMFEGMKGESFNFGTGKPIKTSILLESILKVMNQEVLGITQSEEKRKEIPLQYLSPKKAERLLGFRTTTNLNEGLSKTARWYTEHMEEILKYKMED